MGTPTRIITANDNLPNPLPMPMQAQLIVDEHPASNLNKDFQLSPEINSLSSKVLDSTAEQNKTQFTRSLTVTLAIWVTAIIFALTIFGLSTSTSLKVFCSLVLLWAGLWSSYVCADHGHWRLSELSVMTALAGLLGAITTTANYFGLGLTLFDGLVLMSILPLLIGIMLKSRISILTSIFATLSWGALIFLADGEIAGAVALFPFILAGQIYTATRLRSGLAILLSVGTGYYWGLSLALNLWTADSLPLTFAAAAFFIIGVAHYRCGKASEDAQIAGSAVHIHVGWVAAIVGAIGFQYFWLTPEALNGSTATLSAEGLIFWKGIVIAALSAILGSAIIRYRYSQITFIGMFLLTFACTLLPMTLWFPVWPQALASAIPGMDSMTIIGVIIGAAVTAMAIGMMLNGARRHSLTMIIMGICAVFAEGYLLLKPELITLDYIVIFGAALLAALAIGGIIAGSSLAHQAPAPRLKHA